MKIYAMIGGLPRPSKPNLTNRRERKLKLTGQVHESGESFELGEYYMVIGTSALAGYEIDGVANIYALHRRWLTITGNQYDLAKHREIAELYVPDPWFIACTTRPYPAVPVSCETPWFTGQNKEETGPRQKAGGLSLLRRYIPPPEIQQSEKCKYYGREYKPQQIQLHLGVIGPHPHAQQGVWEHISPPLSGEQ